jgi:hypothetical protein
MRPTYNDIRGFCPALNTVEVFEIANYSPEVFTAFGESVSFLFITN